jgi:hypothetical protein
VLQPAGNRPDCRGFGTAINNQEGRLFTPVIQPSWRGDARSGEFARIRIAQHIADVRSNHHLAHLSFVVGTLAAKSRNAEPVILKLIEP